KNALNIGARRQSGQKKQTSQELQLRRNIGSLNIVLCDRPNFGHVLELECATDRFFVERRIVQSACDAGKLSHAPHSYRRLIEKCARHGGHKITRCARQNLPAAALRLIVSQRSRITSRKYWSWLIELFRIIL